jgi:hypothetical protein
LIEKTPVFQRIGPARLVAPTIVVNVVNPMIFETGVAHCATVLKSLKVTGVGPNAAMHPAIAPPVVAMQIATR